MSVLGPGDLLGEVSPCSGEGASAIVVGVEAGAMLPVPAETIAALAARDAGFGLRLYRSLATSLAGRLRDTTARLPPLLVEEVAQVRRHHTTLTGRLQKSAVPPALGEAIDRFKQGMLEPLGKSASGTVRATCLDIDMEALTFSNHLAHMLGAQGRFQWTQENVIHLGQGAGHTRPAPQDVIYSAGLFDYLTDEQVMQVLDWVHAHLEPRGLAAIGNAAQGCPDQTLFDHLLDWRLRHRSAEELEQLFRRSAFGRSRLEVGLDEARSQLFVLAEREG